MSMLKPIVKTHCTETHQSTIPLVTLHSEFWDNAHKFAVDGDIFPTFRLIGYLEETLIMLKDSSHRINRVGTEQWRKMALK